MSIKNTDKEVYRHNEFNLSKGKSLSINLFHINDYIIDTRQFSSLLSDKIVKEFEQNLASYVGAKYCVSLNSATSAIQLINWAWKEPVYWIPSMIPPVVANAIINTGSEVRFVDHIDWVGNSYILSRNSRGFKVIDSAQKVERNQFNKEAHENDLMIFSHYPTKPVGSCDGGTIVSNDKSKIDYLRTLANNGMTTEHNNWERKQTAIGHKLYMNSISAYMAYENLKKLDEKKEQLKKVRDQYNGILGLNNISEHLYRITIDNRSEVIRRGKDVGITFGIHYEACHHNPIFKQTDLRLPLTDSESKATLSLPYHENMSEYDVDRVIKFING